MKNKSLVILLTLIVFLSLAFVQVAEAKSLKKRVKDAVNKVTNYAMAPVQYIAGYTLKSTGKLTNKIGELTGSGSFEHLGSRIENGGSRAINATKCRIRNSDKNPYQSFSSLCR